MVANTTLITEVLTGLGTLGNDQLDRVLSSFPSEFVGASNDQIRLLQELRNTPTLRDSFEAPFKNGLALFRAADGLNGRRPRIVEWTGGRTTPGDELVPADLRIDHVYLVSCKYFSKVLYNASPARVFDHALSRGPIDDRRNWYSRVSPTTHNNLYRTCVSELGLTSFPDSPDDLDGAQRRDLATALKGRPWSERAAEIYAKLCDEVSRATVERWNEALPTGQREQLTWRILRIGSAPYFLLGSSQKKVMRLRVATPWDLRQNFKFLSFEFESASAGQPKVIWEARYRNRRDDRIVMVNGHIEIRWSHGRFSGFPEAKVYLDCPLDSVPGYFNLDDDFPEDRPQTLFAYP